MSVLKGKRKESKFEVFENYSRVRKQAYLLVKNNLGYQPTKYDKQVERMLQPEKLEELDEDQQKAWRTKHAKAIEFEVWWIWDEKQWLMNSLRNLSSYLYMANSVYPQCQEELDIRRSYQSRCVGICQSIITELQMLSQEVPSNLRLILTIVDLLNQEINLIKAWRKSDNRFKNTFNNSSKASSDGR